MGHFPKLHVFLGAGGVGKTTLSASFALSLANAGKKVGLLSIDPAKRLQSAFGVENLTEEGILIPLENNAGELRACSLQIESSLKRWVKERGMGEEKQKKLYENPYFHALATKLASSNDTLAAIRIAEWIEQYPNTEHFVIDTAPGIHAIDFIAKPEKVFLFLDSKLVDWLKWFVGDTDKKTIFARILKSGAKKILDGLSLVGGRNFLYNFGEFLIMLDDVFFTAIKRLKYTQKWLAHPTTNIMLVTSLRNDALSVGKEISSLLKAMSIKLNLCIINKSFPISLSQDPGYLNFIHKNHEKNSMEELYSNFLSSYHTMQKKAFLELGSFTNHIVELPISGNLDTPNRVRLIDLSSLGDKIQQKMRSINL